MGSGEERQWIGYNESPGCGSGRVGGGSVGWGSVVVAGWWSCAAASLPDLTGFVGIL